jgi:hypothetical protein
MLAACEGTQESVPLTACQRLWAAVLLQAISDANFASPGSFSQGAAGSPTVLVRRERSLGPSAEGCLLARRRRRGGS